MFKSHETCQFTISPPPWRMGMRRIVRTVADDGGERLRLHGPADEAAWIAELREAAREFIADDKIVLSAVRLHVSCFFPRPKRHYFGRRPETKRLRRDAPKGVARGPAIDAIARAAVDALDGIAWAHRAQVAKIEVDKFYTEKADGETCITLTWTP